MKKDKAIISLICATFTVLGFVFAIYYFNSYINDTRHIIYFIISLLAIAESLFAVFSCYLYLRGVKKRFVIIIYIISTILTIPILLLTTFWFLYIIGFKIIPPPQQ